MKINPTPTSLMDDMRIFCFIQKSKGRTLNQIGLKIGKDHATVVYHLKKYDDFSRLDKEFKFKIKEFDENKFLSKYKEVKKKNAVVKKLH